MCGRAPTGSGKTLAFGLTVATRVPASQPKRPGALVLVPTRELAAQVQRELAALSKDGDRRVIAVYGGTGYGPTRQALARGVDTVVACPGRLEDLVAQRAIDLSAVRIVVLDEADRMADMGFLPAVRRLLNLTPAKRQMLLFSATLGAEVETLVRGYQSDPARHDVVGDESASPDVAHLFWQTAREQRVQVTARLVREHGRALVFCRTRRGADRLTRRLNTAGVKAAAIHGDRTQSQRERALAAFDVGRTRALVATDVAARGIHVEDLPCVVHFDPPADHKDYMHRSGRTGRAGKSGIVVSLVDDGQRQAIRALQKSLGFVVGLDRGDGPSVAGRTGPAAARRACGSATAAPSPRRRAPPGTPPRRRRDPPPRCAMHPGRSGPASRGVAPLAGAREQRTQRPGPIADATADEGDRQETALRSLSSAASRRSSSVGSSLSPSRIRSSSLSNRLRSRSTSLSCSSSGRRRNARMNAAWASFARFSFNERATPA